MSLRTVILTVWLSVCVLGCSAEKDAAQQSSDVAEASHGKSSAVDRGQRRLYDGAPPIIPHAPFGAACIACHNNEGLAVADVGFAPPSPHGAAAVAGALRRCQQCHVFQRGEATWSETTFVGLKQDLRRGRRLYDGAPPVLPHRVLMRENCLTCHSGPAAREEIRTSHPERIRCLQCHVEQTTTAVFSSAGS